MQTQMTVEVPVFKTNPVPRSARETELYLISKSLFEIVRDLSPEKGEKFGTPLLEAQKLLVRGSPKMKAVRAQWDEENFLNLAISQHSLGPENWKRGGREKWILGVKFSETAIAELDELLRTGQVRLRKGALDRHGRIKKFLIDFTD